MAQLNTSRPDRRLLESIADEYGTPVMIYDEDMIRERMRDYVWNFSSNLFSTRVLYASKAFLCKRIARTALDNLMYFDAVSGGEIHCLAAAGVPAEKIYFHGNNKTHREIREFFALGCGHIVVDNPDEMNLIAQIANEACSPMDIIIRVNPGVEAHTHQYIATANRDSKFGVSIDRTDTIREMIDIIYGSDWLSFKGFHSHIGSQIFETDAFAAQISVMFDFIERVINEWDITVSELDLGGGFAIRYTDDENPPATRVVCQTIIRNCEQEMLRRGIRISTILIEPGRSIAGDAGYTLYTAGCRKVTDSVEYVFADGGMADNIRPALYEAAYSCTNITREDMPLTNHYAIAGKCCESGDILIRDALMPETFPGDLLLVPSTGAYGYSMASCYNRLGRPPVVFLTQGRADCIIRRETYDDMMALEVSGL